MDKMAYRLGGLLYTPAAHSDIQELACGNVYKDLFASVFCLEDSIEDSHLREAEIALHGSLQKVKARAEREGKRREDMTLLFVRVRTPEHLERLLSEDVDVLDTLTGFVLPKFDLGNADRYLELMREVNAYAHRPVYVMPILESAQVAQAVSRRKTLSRIKAVLDPVREIILNVRVGGNDFCNLYGLRRSVTQTIYDIGVVRDILVDILNTFAQDYVVSGPVWEYFGSDVAGAWARGLRDELELDRVNGFIGKTVIHPSQLPLVADSLRVSSTDYEDACRILCCDKADKLAVAKSAAGDRMNEGKTHGNWAKRIKLLGDIYGFKDGSRPYGGAAV